MLNTFKLKNGLKVATYSIPQMRSVFLGISVKGGSIFDVEKTSGAAHFMEHMLVQGIPSYPNVESFSNFIEGLAGSYNAATHAQSIKFIISAPAKNLEDLLKISGEVFYEPLFPQEALERERGAVLEEIRSRQDALWYKNNKFFAESRFKKGHPMLLDGGGGVASVLNLEKQDLLDYYKKFFFPANSYLILVGGFENKNAKKLINNIFNKYNSKKKFPDFPEFTNKDFSERKVVIRNDKELKTCYVDLTFPTINGEDFDLKDSMPQYMVGTIMARLRNSRLFRLLRQQRGLVYSVDCGASVYQKFGYGYVTTQVVAEKLDEVLSLITKELLGFYQNGPTEDELNFAKNYLINSAMMQFDHPGRIVDWIEGDLLWEDKIYSPEEYSKIIEKVTAKEIVNFMQKNWDFSKLNLSIQGPVASSKANFEKYTNLISELK